MNKQQPNRKEGKEQEILPTVKEMKMAFKYMRIFDLMYNERNIR
jgi:hypothetical protein